MRMKALDDEEGRGDHFLSGIVPHNCRLDVTDIEKQPNTLFMYHPMDVEDVPEISEDSKIGRSIEADMTQAQLTEREFEITYMRGDLYFAAANSNRVKVRESIPPGDY